MIVNKLFPQNRLNDFVHEMVMVYNRIDFISQQNKQKNYINLQIQLQVPTTNANNIITPK